MKLKELLEELRLLDQENKKNLDRFKFMVNKLP